MSILRQNVIANYLGQAAASLVGFISIPFYIKYLGQEGYGLVSFFLSLQAITSILDMGLSTTANREISIATVRELGVGAARSLMRTFEWLYYGIAAILVLGFIASAEFLATSWIKADELSPQAIRTCVAIAGVTIALRWPISLYSGALRGLEKQVPLNFVCSALAVGKAVGSILLLVFISRRVEVFYWVQLVFACGETLGMALVVWHYLGGWRGATTRFEWPILRRTWRFAFSVGWITAFAMVLKQGDKIVISRLLPIEYLGFYTTAAIAGMGLVKLVGPVQGAVFPRFTRLFELGAEAELTHLFRQCSQVVAYVAAPAACLLAWFPQEVLLLWTRSVVVAREAEQAMVFFALAMLLNLMMSVPFALQLAAGMTWLPLRTNGIGAACLLPLTVVLTLSLGISGAAISWLVFNVAYYVIVPQVMFRHVLKGQQRAWYFRDTLPFIGAGLAFLGVARLVARPGASLWVSGLAVVLAGLAYAVVGLALAPSLRASIAKLQGIRGIADRLERRFGKPALLVD